MTYTHARWQAAADHVRWWHPAILWLAHAAAGAAGIIPGTWRHAVTITTAAVATALLALIEVRVSGLRAQLAGDCGGRTLAMLPGGKDQPGQVSARLADCEAMIDALFDLFEVACADRGIDLGPLPENGLRLVGGTTVDGGAV